MKGTALHEAETVEEVERLLDEGGKVDRPGWMGATPLFRAAERGLTEVARALLARLAELAPVDLGETPIKPTEVLHAVLRRRPDGSPQPMPQPLIPLLDTTLLVYLHGAEGAAARATLWAASINPAAVQGSPRRTIGKTCLRLR